MPSRQPEDERLLTVDEVAAMLRVRPVTVRVWLRHGKLRGSKIGPKLWRVPESAVSELLNKGD